VDAAESFGRISIEDDQPNYVGSSHWAAILDNVSISSSAIPHRDVKSLLTNREQISFLKDRLGAAEPPQKEAHPSPSIQGPDLLVGSVRAATRAEIMAALPSRSVVDALVAEFCTTPDMGCCKFGFLSEHEIF
jgi:hypothetical protein